MCFVSQNESTETIRGVGVVVALDRVGKQTEASLADSSQNNNAQKLALAAEKWKVCFLFAVAMIALLCFVSRAPVFVC